jgi:hypothetical protein
MVADRLCVVVVVQVDESCIVITTGSSGGFLLSFIGAFDEGYDTLYTHNLYTSQPFLQCEGV